MKRSLVGLAALTLLAMGSTAAAQTVIREENKTVVRKKTVIDFQDVTIDGEIKKPEGSYTVGHAKTKFGNLVKLRSDFMPELQKSVDNL